jgi:hypothetical protein
MPNGSRIANNGITLRARKICFHEEIGMLLYNRVDTIMPRMQGYSLEFSLLPLCPVIMKLQELQTDKVTIS